MSAAVAAAAVVSTADAVVAAPTAAAAAAPAKGANAKAKRSPLNDAAVHVLKSALLAVVGAQCSTTQSVDYAHATKGEITVSYEGETLSLEVYSQIEAKCNELIAADIPIADLPLLPADEVTTCAGPHVERTGELRSLKLLKMRNRKNSKGYEFSFVVHSAAEELIAKNAAAVAAVNSKKTQAVQKAAVAASNGEKKKESSSTGSSTAAAASSAATAAPASTDYVVDTTSAIFNELIVPAFAKLQSASAAPSADGSASLTPSELSALRSTLLPSLESYLVMFANQAYTRGFTAQKTGKGTTDLAQLL